MLDLQQCLKAIAFVRQLLLDFVGEPNTPETQAAIERRVQEFLHSDEPRLLQ